MSARMSNIELPPLRHSLPTTMQPYDFMPYKVPKRHWERAKRQFMEHGGVNGTEQIARFVSNLTNTDVLPQVAATRLESLCVDEARVLLKMLDVLRPPAALHSMTRKTSLTGRKFASFRGGGDRTPRGSFRLTPRRSSLQQTPLDETIAPPPLLMPVQSSTDVVPGEVRRMCSLLRLSIDATNVTMVARTITQLLPLDLMAEVLQPTQDALQFLQTAAKGASTCNPRKGSGTLTLEQFALLLSYFASPQAPGDELPRLGGAVNENHESVEALLAALPEEGVETEVEAILASIGITSSHMHMAFGKHTSPDSPVSPSSKKWSGFMGQVKELLQEPQIDGEEDVLQRRTPTRRKNSVRMFMPANHNRDAALAHVELGDSTSLSLSRSDKSPLALQQSISVGPSASGVTPRRTPRSPMDTSATDSGWFGSVHALKEPSKPVVEFSMEVPDVSSHRSAMPPPRPTVATSHAATQTDTISFTLMWLGIKTKTRGTTTERSGHVGKVVSLQLLKSERRRRNNPKPAADDLQSLPLAQLEDMYRAMIAKSKKEKAP